MDKQEYYDVLESSVNRIRRTSMDIKRYLCDSLDWRDRLIAVLGSRGTGKTTMLLQHIRDEFRVIDERAIYVSLDNLWFETHDLISLVDMHYKSGGTHIFIDEIHHLDKWQKVLKNIYDEYPGMNIVYTGSSLLKMDAQSGDLSRRQITYQLPGLSFREYLYFEGEDEFAPVSLKDLLKNHIEIAEEITKKVKVMKLFDKYLESGYYPFYKEVYSGYDVRLMQITNQILESDYPATESISYSTVQKIKKMLYILAQSCPQTPNMAELYRQLDTDRNLGLKMLYILDRANLLNTLSSEKNTLKNMARPDKIYCDNTNIMYSLTERPDIGTKRETFFLNQMKSAGHTVLYPPKGDFLVDEKYLFEVGGRTKNFEQIKDIPDSYLAIDDEEIGRKNRIPLWLFGMMY